MAIFYDTGYNGLNVNYEQSKGQYMKGKCQSL